MKQFFGNLGYSFRQWMGTRYGMDSLCLVLSLTGVVLCILRKLTDVNILGTAGVALMFISILRSYSGNTEKRRAELAVFRRKTAFISGPVKAARQNKKDGEHLYICCRRCRTVTRVPRGKGSIIVTCPGCGDKIKTHS